MKENVKGGLAKAILSTIGVYEKKAAKWTLIGIASAEIGMHSCDMIADMTNAGQKYTEHVKKAVEDEERVFGIKFEKVPEVVIGYVKSRDALMSEFEKEIGYEQMSIAEKVPAKAASYLLSTLSAVSFSCFFGPRIIGGQIKGLSVEDKVYFAPGIGEAEFTEMDSSALSHEIFHAYIHQKNPGFNQPYYGDRDETARELALVRLTANEGLATYCAFIMAIEKRGEIERKDIEARQRQAIDINYSYCMKQGFHLEDKLCQYIIGYKFTDYVVERLSSKSSVDIIIQNPPNTKEELSKPEKYLRRILNKKK